MCDKPRVVAEDVAEILRRATDPVRGGMEVPVVAARAGVSVRTVYRALAPKKRLMDLESADLLLMATGRLMHDVRLECEEAHHGEDR